MFQNRLLAFVLMMGFPVACSSPAPDAPLTEIPLPAGFAETVAQIAPKDNSLTEARAQLGRRLFYDSRLSRDKSISCSSCHLQKNGFADPRPQSLGVEGRKGKRNAPHLANLAWVATGLFWDGRAKTLEEQAGKPIEDTLEMDLPMDQAVARLAADPKDVLEFQAAFGQGPNRDTLQKALASFMRTLVSANSRYDAYMAGDRSALDDAEQRGRELFLSSRTGCFHCHGEQTTTNDGFFNNGSHVEGGDPGLQALTGRTGDLGRFRVPNLRNVEVTAPYMHDGSLGTLQAVIEQYNKGGRGHPSTDPQIEVLNLSAQEQADLIAFLKSLTDHKFLTDPRFAAP